MSQQNFTNYTYIMELVKRSEKLFEEVQNLDNLKMPNDEEKLFIDAIRDLNQHAQEMLTEEKSDSNIDDNDDDDDDDDNHDNTTTSLNLTKDTRISESFSPNVHTAIGWIHSLKSDKSDKSNKSDSNKSDSNKSDKSNKSDSNKSNKSDSNKNSDKGKSSDDGDNKSDKRRRIDN